MTGGTHLTNVFCHRHDKTHIFVNLENAEAENIKKVAEWIYDIKPQRLNIAGPRESKQPGIYEKTRKLLENIFKKFN